MEKWNFKKQMPKWLTPVLFSIFIHVIIVAILVQQHLSEQTTQQKAQAKKPIKAIKSYLIVAKPKVKKAAVEKVEQKEAPTSTTVKPKPKKKRVVKETTKKPKTKPTPPPEKKKVTPPTPTKTKQPVQSSVVVEQPNPQTPPPNSMMIINKKPTGISAARDYLNQSQVIPPTSWQEHQFEQTQNKLNEQIENEKVKKYEGKFTSGIRDMKDLGKQGDGSQLVKSGDACYAIKKDQFGDSVWLNTPCPLSADPLRQAFRNSMKKYVKKKN